MEFENIIKERYSVRSYTDKEIEEEKLNKIYEAGMVSPTAKNYQPQRIYVLKSKEALDKINGLTKCIYGAPMAFLCCYDKNLSWKNRLSNEDSGVEDVSICVTHMMLEAWNLNIGSCWVNMFDSNEVKKAFKLPENIVPVALLPLGYKSDDAKPIDLHFNKKEKEEIFIEL